MSRTPLTLSKAHVANLPETYTFSFSCTSHKSQGSSQETQPASQSQPSQGMAEELKRTLWGYLDPRGVSPMRINLCKGKNKYTIGRALDSDCVLNGNKMSSRHCVLHFETYENDAAVVTITDLSRNGTFVNSDRIGRGITKVLRDGNEVAFGDPRKHPDNGDIDDFRYIFRCLVAEAPKGKIQDEYQLVHELGRGSFGTVHLAVHSTTGMRFAVKVVPRAEAHVPRGSQSAKALAREISIWRRLRHPHVCRFQEVAYEERTIYIVLEYAAGGNLAKYIAKLGRLDEVEARRLTYQICEALAYVHRKGIAHRDLKPENILLTLDSPPQVKVADFGLAKAVTSGSLLATVCGTPGYMAPEVEMQRHLQGVYNHTVDSWSLGIIVFEMLTGRTPMPLHSDEELSTYAVERDMGVSTQAWDLLEKYAVSEEAERFIRALLASSPQRRLTASDALAHPWLAPIARTRGSSSRTSSHSSLSSVDDADETGPPSSGSTTATIVPAAAASEGKRHILPPPDPQPTKRARVVSPSMPVPPMVPLWGATRRPRRAKTMQGSRRS
ncbi:hypothetical protein CERSUDRAFT_117897 [Gelatoporia subvermispora B]|uniref:Uncharacterized protein n=1 Tax=Ceriporiopsis subvermispora (strain B) TaxID=914234 RepID=M2QNU0_CERS8|nr:hypothetical protein CERSUDRAFT_117897 [Gelatoporia subvermispora B]